MKNYEFSKKPDPLTEVGSVYSYMHCLTELGQYLLTGSKNIDALAPSQYESIIDAKVTA